MKPPLPVRCAAFPATANPARHDVPRLPAHHRYCRRSAPAALLMIPTAADFASPVAADVDQYYQGARAASVPACPGCSSSPGTWRATHSGMRYRRYYRRGPGAAARVQLCDCTHCVGNAIAWCRRRWPWPGSPPEPRRAGRAQATRTTTADSSASFAGVPAGHSPMASRTRAGDFPAPADSGASFAGVPCGTRVPGGARTRRFAPRTARADRATREATSESLRSSAPPTAGVVGSPTRQGRWVAWDERRWYFRDTLRSGRRRAASGADAGADAMALWRYGDMAVWRSCATPPL